MPKFQNKLTYAIYTVRRNCSGEITALGSVSIKVPQSKQLLRMQCVSSATFFLKFTNKQNSITKATQKIQIITRNIRVGKIKMKLINLRSLISVYTRNYPT